MTEFIYKHEAFNKLNAINVNDHTEKKNGLTYLSWAWAWAEVKKLYPDSIYTVYENKDGWNYFTDGKTCWVKTGVTIDGIEHIEYLPVMDFKNKSIPANAVTSFDVNKAIQRSLTKACARHGLGLYIYAGEDLPEEDPAQAQETPKKPAPKKAAKQEAPKCENCGNPIEAVQGKDGNIITADQLMKMSNRDFGANFCPGCYKKKYELLKLQNKIKSNHLDENMEEKKNA